MLQGKDVIGAEPTQTIEAGVREITQRAYQFYEERGCAAGHALDDWLDAELWVRRCYDERFQLQPFEAEVAADTKSSRPTHLAHRPTRQIAMGLIMLSAAASGATLVVLVGSHKVPVRQRPSLAEQIALTSGYRAILYNPGTYGH